MNHLEVVGVITLSSPCHQTSVEGADGNRTPTGKTLVVGEDCQVREVPFVTGNSVRGRIHRIVAERVLTKIAPVSRELAMCLCKGSAGSRGDLRAGEINPRTLAQAKDHAVVGLFGGGPYMLSSNLRIGNLYPLVEWTKPVVHPRNAHAVIPAEKLPRRLTVDLGFTARDDMAAGKLAPYVLNHDEEFVAWISRVNASSQAKKAAKAEGKGSDVKKEDARFFGFYEAILPGLPLQLEVHLDHPTEAQAGIVLSALLDWANENILGGGSARGLGTFKLTAALIVDGKQLTDTLFMPAETGYRLSEAAGDLVRAGDLAIASMTASDLLAFYPAGESAEDGKPQRAAKNAAEVE